MAATAVSAQPDEHEHKERCHNEGLDHGRFDHEHHLGYKNRPAPDCDRRLYREDYERGYKGRLEIR